MHNSDRFFWAGITVQKPSDNDKLGRHSLTSAQVSPNNKVCTFITVEIFFDVLDLWPVG